jgi:hypothetical protein
MLMLSACCALPQCMEEVQVLRDRVRVLEAENARLTEQLSHARAQLLGRRRDGMELSALDHRPPTSLLRASSAYARTFGGSILESGLSDGDVTGPSRPAAAAEAAGSRLAVEAASAVTTVGPSDGSLCSNCGRAIPADNLSKHQLHCLRNIAKCPHCSEALPIKEVESHVAARRGTRCVPVVSDLIALH